MFADLDRDVNLDIMRSKNHENPSRESSRFSFVPEDLWTVRHRNSKCENRIASTFDNQFPVVKRSILITLDLCGNETARIESAWPRPTTYHLPQYYYVLIIVSNECLYLFHQKHYFMFLLVLLYRRIPCESIHLLHSLFFSWILYAKFMPRRPVFSQYHWQLFLLGVRWLLLIGFWLCIFRHFVSSLFNFICNFINISVYSMKK